MTVVIVAALDVVRPYAYMRLCNLYRDGLSRGGQTTPANPNLAFLAIDAASVNLDEHDIEDLFELGSDDSKAARALRLMSQRFPWSREVYALVLERLVSAGAKVVAFDLMFPGPSEADPIFRAAIDRYADHVVIGSNFVDGTLTRPSETLIDQTSPIDDRIGFTNFWADNDDVVRRARFHATFEQVRQTPSRPGSEEFASLAAVALTKAGFTRRVPTDVNDHALRFTAAPRQGFPSRSLFEIFVPSYWEQNYQSGEFFRNKIVIIGADGNWQHDDHPTPLGNMPGAELHLNAINAALHKEFLRELPAPVRVGYCAGAALTAILLSIGLRLPWLRFLASIALTGGLIGLSYVCFNRLSIYLPMVGPATAMNGAMLLGLVYDFTSEHREKARLRRTLERYVSRDVVQELVDRPEQYGATLGGVVRPAAILFSDIRSFSSVTRTSAPETLVTQLNEYFTAMVECVFQCGGTLDKFIGDALMAVWGTLHSQGARHDAISAVRAALLMHQKLGELNATWRAKGWPELRVGIGINHGDVVVGNVGSPRRMEFTVIGDAVNQSWRLQELTKNMNTAIILSPSVALLVADEFLVRSLGDIEGSQVREGYALCDAEGEIVHYGVGRATPAPDIRSDRERTSLSPTT
ncbi:MAG TPA: adenylate/guanylate cyclase domain-containing protein [Chthoniobacterales bacterium]|nr:adenylate/guanylate cyclase domain-containing protein [Chthoniobacterales bacterium]